MGHHHEHEHEHCCENGHHHEHEHHHEHSLKGQLTLIVLTAVLTGLGIFDKIAKHAGAGTFVPVTGFANAVVSPAMEFASEGRVLGTAAQMFRIAGPVLVYGCTLSSAYGFFCWLFR